MTKPFFDFMLIHKEVDGRHVLTVTPSKKNPGYAPKEIEITEGQWNDLRFHFASALIDQEGRTDTQLTYIV